MPEKTGSLLRTTREIRPSGKTVLPWVHFRLSRRRRLRISRTGENQAPAKGRAGSGCLVDKTLASLQWAAHCQATDQSGPSELLLILGLVTATENRGLLNEQAHSQLSYVYLYAAFRR